MQVLTHFTHFAGYQLRKTCKSNFTDLVIGTLEPFELAVNAPIIRVWQEAQADATTAAAKAAPRRSLQLAPKGSGKAGGGFGKAASGKTRKPRGPNLTYISYKNITHEDEGCLYFSSKATADEV